MSIQPQFGDQSDRPVARPRLLIDGRATTADAVDPGHPLLGLTLLERTTLAARRGGYGRIFVLAKEVDVRRFQRLIARIDDVQVGASVPVRDETAAGTVCVSGLILGERDWLEAAAGIAVPDDGSLAVHAGVVVCGHRVPLARAASMAADPPPTGIAAMSAEPPFMIVGAADLRVAERRLLQSLVKSTDGFMARHVERPISIALSRILAPMPITPNQVTIFSVVVGLVGAPFFLSASPLWQTIGALLFLAHSILDGCDGELARLRFQESRGGGILDFWGDNVVHAAVFGCMAMGWSLTIEADLPLALGAMALFGALGSAGFIYWRVMHSKRSDGPFFTSVAREPKGRLAAVLDSLSRRDFVYFVVILSLFGKAAWFLVLAALGAPAFLIMLLVVAARERRTNQAIPG